RKLARARSALQPSQQSMSFIDRMLVGFEAFAGRTLILLSERDLTAQEFRDLCRSSSAWGAAIRRPGVTVHACSQADHTFSQSRARDEATSAILQWLQQHAVAAPAKGAPAIAGGAIAEGAR